MKDKALRLSHGFEERHGKVFFHPPAAATRGNRMGPQFDASAEGQTAEPLLIPDKPRTLLRCS